MAQSSSSGGQGQGSSQSSGSRGSSASSQPSRKSSSSSRKSSASSRPSSSSSTKPSIFVGFDRSAYPTDAAMQNAYKGNGGPFSWVGFYLAPAPQHADASWMGKKMFLQGIGYGFGVLYVGRQLNSANLTAQQGALDGANAINLAKTAGFAGHIIFLDVEAGAGAITPALLSYIDGWLDAVDTSGTHKPGVYCSYKTNADQIKNSRPNMGISFWVFRLSAPSPGCTTDVGALTPADSGVAYANVWQYAQNCAGPIGGITALDLDLADSINPSAF